MPSDTNRLIFDLGALEVFLAVCDANGMAPAARRLDVTQSAISQTINDLEKKLGTQLFDRSVRPLGLTAAGSMLRQRAQFIVAEAHQVLPAIREASRGKLPFLRIGLVDSVNRALLPSLVRFLNERFAQTSFYTSSTSRLARALISRQIDVVIGTDALDDVENVERHHIFKEPYVLVAPHKTYLPEDYRLEDVFGMHPLIRYSLDSITGMEIERYLRRLGLDIIRCQEFETTIGVTTAVSCGLGCAISTPLCLWESRELINQISCHRLPSPGAVRDLVLAYRKGELGRFGLDLAESAKCALSTAKAKLQADIPWLGDQSFSW